MKKRLALLCLMLLTVAMTACAQKENSPTPTPDNTHEIEEITDANDIPDPTEVPTTTPEEQTPNETQPDITTELTTTPEEIDIPKADDGAAALAIESADQLSLIAGGHEIVLGQTTIKQINDMFPLLWTDDRTGETVDITTHDTFTLEDINTLLYKSADTAVGLNISDMIFEPTAGNENDPLLMTLTVQTLLFDERSHDLVDGLETDTDGGFGCLVGKTTVDELLEKHGETASLETENGIIYFYTVSINDTPVAKVQFSFVSNELTENKLLLESISLQL